MTTEAARPASTTTLAQRIITPGPDAEHDRANDAADTRPDAGGRWTTVVHGFAQNRDCLGPLLDALVVQGPVRAVDAPGHGASVRHARADLWSGAELLVATTGVTDLVGYSMGARLSLHAALAAPTQVSSLVLIGGTAGLDDAEDRAARRASDELLARRLEDDGLEAFLESWLALPLFAGLPDWARFEAQRHTNTVEGLAASLRAAGTGAMDPLWDALSTIRCPVLCVTGSLDERYGELAGRIVDRVGGPAKHVVIDGAGHAAHLERPEATSAAVSEFLAAQRVTR